MLAKLGVISLVFGFFDVPSSSVSSCFSHTKANTVSPAMLKGRDCRHLQIPLRNVQKGLSFQSLVKKVDRFVDEAGTGRGLPSKTSSCISIGNGGEICVLTNLMHRAVDPPNGRLYSAWASEMSKYTELHSVETCLPVLS